MCMIMKDITYIRKFVIDKKLLNVGAPVSCAWVLFDKSNGDATSKLYLWVHNSKRKVLNQYNEHKKNDSLSKLSYPQRYFSKNELCDLTNRLVVVMVAILMIGYFIWR